MALLFFLAGGVPSGVRLGAIAGLTHDPGLLSLCVPGQGKSDYKALHSTITWLVY